MTATSNDRAVNAKLWLSALAIILCAFGLGYLLTMPSLAEQRLAAKIDLSISPVRLLLGFAPPPDGDPMPVLAEEYRLRFEPDDICRRSDTCPWVDAHGVNHGGSVSYGTVEIVKSLGLDDNDRHRVTALGIGTARSEADVMQAIRTFSPDIHLPCEDAVSFAGRDCTTRIGDDYLSIEFDSNDRLTFLYWSHERTHWSRLPWGTYAGLLVLGAIVGLILGAKSSSFVEPLPDQIKGLCERIMQSLYWILVLIIGMGTSFWASIIVTGFAASVLVWTLLADARKGLTKADRETA